MAKNVTLMGASYPDVPAVNLPQTGGGTARFTDTSGTTATASDVAQGKVFYAADGTETTGTASGGSATIESLSVTANGTYTAPSGVDGYSPVVVNVPTGGGASNFFSGEVYLENPVNTVEIPYTGNGYPIMAAVYVKGGIYNNTASGDSSWYNLVQRYAVGFWAMHKRIPDVEPTFATSGDQNMAVVECMYKSSASTATSYSRTSGLDANIFSSSAATAGGVCLCAIQSKKYNVISRGRIKLLFGEGTYISILRCLFGIRR